MNLTVPPNDDEIILVWKDTVGRVVVDRDVCPTDPEFIRAALIELRCVLIDISRQSPQ